MENITPKEALHLMAIDALIEKGMPNLTILEPTSFISDWEDVLNGLSHKEVVASRLKKIDAQENNNNANLTGTVNMNDKE